nr:MAG TPA: hypothetical protein [Crassvirales sp.]
MAQIRQRNVSVQVTSADPSGKVFKGIYADSSYRTLLTSDKTYDFKLNAGQTKELYIRYSQKPITITFKSHPAVHYQVTGSFGTVEVNDEDVVKTVEFPTDTTPDLVMDFTSAILSQGYGGEWKIINTKINGSIVSLPYSINHATPGTNLTFEIDIVSTTTTTTSTPAPATLLFKNVNNIAYTATYNGGQLVSVTNADVSKLIDVHSITDGTQVTLNSVISANDSWKVNQVKVGGTVRELPYTFVVNSGTSTAIEPVFKQVTTTTTTTTPPPAVLKLKSNASGTVVKLTTEGLDPETVDLPLSGTSQSSIKIDMKNAPLVDD